MVDRLTKEKRSWNMSRIRCKDTAPEVMVRSFLFKRGFRFRKNVKTLPGKPDIVLPKYKTVIFINGCFWHHHDNCRFATTPKSSSEFWLAKFKKNILNDRKNTLILESSGWTVITIWECELKKDFLLTMNRIVNMLKIVF